MQKLASLKRHQTLLWVLLSAFLVIFCKAWEPGLGISSTTYGAIAKNILVDHEWFHLKLAAGIFDPFIEHPPLVLWMDAVVFKIFGISAQTIRLVAAVMGLGVFAALFSVVKSRISETAGVFAALSLLLVNVYMNFNSSGWLDMPMIGFVWLGFAMLVFAKLKGPDADCYKISIGAILLGCAVLAKGASALAVIPVMLWFLATDRKWKTMLLAILMMSLPIALFTALHFQSQGFLFWQRYFIRQAVAQNHLDSQSTADYVWYLMSLWKFGHIVLLLGLVGCFQLFRRKKADLALLILGQLALHTAAYTLSSRHFPQYSLPVFPWLALGSGVALESAFRRVQALTLAKGLAAVALTAFVILDILPIRVHSGSENALRAMTSTVNLIGDNKTVYFYGQINDQSPWETMSSYVAWFWDRKPVMRSVDEMFENLSDQDPQALGIMKADDFAAFGRSKLTNYSKIKICLENDDVVLFSNVAICGDDILRERPRENYRQIFSR